MYVLGAKARLLGAQRGFTRRQGQGELRMGSVEGQDGLGGAMLSHCIE